MQYMLNPPNNATTGTAAGVKNVQSTTATDKIDTPGEALPQPASVNNSTGMSDNSEIDRAIGKSFMSSSAESNEGVSSSQEGEPSRKRRRRASNVSTPTSGITRNSGGTTTNSATGFSGEGSSNDGDNRKDGHYRKGSELKRNSSAQNMEIFQSNRLTEIA